MANTEKQNMNELRRQIRSMIQETIGLGAPTGPSGTPRPGGVGEVIGTSNAEKKMTLNVSVKPDATIQSSVVDITKSAAYGLERLELLKKRDFPTHKSANAVSTALDALELIFQDMLKNPMGYLDEDPTEKVAEYEQSLDSEEALLSKGAPATF